jgi:hypothetical protein
LGTTIPNIPVYSTPSEAALLAAGTTAIARTEPTNPAFDLSVFLGELRAEGLPNLPGSSVMDRTKAANKAGSEYLNTEFGWLPLVRGIRDFASVVNRSDEIVRSYQENANIVIKRSYEWPTEESSRYDARTFSSRPAVNTFVEGGRYQRAFKKQWFEADYIYHLPVGNSANDKFRRYGSYARKLLGIDLSPEVLWNLAPWSWAVDWFSNTGDVMHNISALGTDGLVMRHGYLMTHICKITEDHGRHQSASFPQYRTRTQEVKLRRAATPYGFGVTFSSLSAKQVAIISALGLSRW